MQAVGGMLSQIFNHFNPGLIPTIITSYRAVFILLLIAFAIHWLPVIVKDRYKELFIGVPYVAKAVIVVVIVFIIYQAKSSEIQPFIYFQF